MFVEEVDAALNLHDNLDRTALDWAIIQLAGGTGSYFLNDERCDRTGAEAVVKYVSEGTRVRTVRHA